MQLIKEITGELFTEITGPTLLCKSVIGELHREDYISLNGFIAYLQNFSKIERSSRLIKPINIGLINQNNISMVTLEIDY